MYRPGPLPTAHITLPDDLARLEERLAAHNHDVWAQQRLAEGWTYGARRDDVAKTHPWLVPYDQLPDSEKQYDRNAATETLKAIVALGYRIVKD